MAKKVVLAYSGGLDTSVITHWLSQKGWEVICVLVDLGQCNRYGQPENLQALSQRAISSGASHCVIRDAKMEFVRDGVFQCLKAQAKYEGNYLMGTAIARPFIMREVIAQAKEEDTKYVAHGATGKGNDQCRFELTAYALMPGVKVIAPWRIHQFRKLIPGRKEAIAYAKAHGIQIEATEEEPFSTDANIAHMSHEAGVLEDPSREPPLSVYQMTLPLHQARSGSEDLTIQFCKGMPQGVQAKFLDRVFWPCDPVEILRFLNERGRLHGIPPVDMVENRFVGMKSRGVYEAPGMAILFGAHRALEQICMDRDLMHIRDMLAPLYAERVYYGYLFSPLIEALNAFVNASQEYVTGEVMVRLEQGHVEIISRTSPFSLYDAAIASMEKGGTFHQGDAAGFLKIVGLPLKLQARRKKKVG